MLLTGSALPFVALGVALNVIVPPLIEPVPNVGKLKSHSGLEFNNLNGPIVSELAILLIYSITSIVK